MTQNKRKVTRVLVMLEYEGQDPDNGEVYDLTAVAQELAGKSQFGSCDLAIEVQAERNYESQNAPPHLFARWRSYISGGDFASSPYLADVVNVALPDNERVKRLRQAAKRLHKKAESVDFSATQAKLEQVAEVRHLHPVARVTVSQPLLP